MRGSTSFLLFTVVSLLLFFLLPLHASHDPLVFDAPRIDTLVEMRDGGGVAGRS